MAALMGWLACALASVLCVASSAQAQTVPHEGFRLERFVPAPTPEDGFALTLPTTLAPMRWSSMLAFGYAFRPFTLAGPPARDLIEHRLGGTLNLALGLVNGLAGYVRLPFVLVTTGESGLVEQTAFATPGGFALGDLALGGTATVWRVQALTLGARGEVLLPTGSQSELAGDYAIAPRGHALVSYTLDRFTFGGEGGAVYRPDRDYGPVRIGSELEATVGVRLRALDSLDLWAECFGTRSLRRASTSAALDTLDLLFGARHRAPVGPFYLLSGGAIGAGFSDTAGDPSLRLMFNVAVTSAKAPDSGTRPAPEPAIAKKP